MILNANNSTVKKNNIDPNLAISFQKNLVQLQKHEYGDFFKNDQLNDLLSNYSGRIPTDIRVERASFQETFGQFYNMNLKQEILFDDNISIFIDNNNQHDQDSTIDSKQHKIDQEQLNQEMLKEINQENEEKHVKLKRTDQYLFKRRHTILKKSLMNLKLRHFIKKYKSHRKDYFILILNLIELEGVLFQLKQQYLIIASQAITQINQLLKLQNCQEKNHLDSVVHTIKNSIMVVEMFCDGRISQSFDLIYGVGKLTRIQDYQTAKKMFNKERVRLGLKRQI